MIIIKQTNLMLNQSNFKENLSVAALVEETIKSDQGKLSISGALVINTGKFTGRSPKDRYVVEDEITRSTVDWGQVNIPISNDSYQLLKEKIKVYANGLEKVFVRDAYACASDKYRINIRVHTEFPWQNMFAYNMFLRPDNNTSSEIKIDEWSIYAFPSVLAESKLHHTRQENFSIINFKEKTIIIGGTAYTGEIKKGIFSVLNYTLPMNQNVLSMHCSANVGSRGDTALFFGLSGTGKTTLSNDPDRRLIGDDEHGWSKANVFNLEGGCYAKTIDLSPAKEPQIYKAIKFGALLENIGFEEDNFTPDYRNSDITQNTRVSYPLYHIDNIMYNSRGDLPRNIFFLTADAFGILPPISRLDSDQAMYHFMSGYTAKIAGTEDGINEPVATFSACFGSPFLPLHPSKYADMLGSKLEDSKNSSKGPINVWLVSTGWTGGVYGVGSRMELPHTRAMIKAAIEGKLDKVEYQNLDIFNLKFPTSCPDVPSEVLNPRAAWKSNEEYDAKAKYLAELFNENFKQFAVKTQDSIVAAGPSV